jgi:hypothetical protein
VVVDLETGIKREAPSIVVRRRDDQVLPIEIPADEWHTHPDGDDIAVAAVALSAATYNAAAFPTYAFLTAATSKLSVLGLESMFTTRAVFSQERADRASQRFDSAQLAQCQSSSRTQD